MSHLLTFQNVAKILWRTVLTVSVVFTFTITMLATNIHIFNEILLRFSACENLLTTVGVLLDNGANIHALDDQALSCAAMSGYDDMVKLLLARGADVHAGHLALFSAAKHGHLSIVKLLLDHGAAENDCHTVAAVNVAKDYGHNDISKLISARVGAGNRECKLL